ncbi:MAG: hypothetical protein ACOX52_17745 [Verrucomicrobiota bacterium]
MGGLRLSGGGSITAPGLLMGTLVLTNPAGSGQTLSKELRISYMPTADKRIWRPDGKTETEGADELRVDERLPDGPVPCR